MFKDGEDEVVKKLWVYYQLIQTIKNLENKEKPLKIVFRDWSSVVHICWCLDTSLRDEQHADQAYVLSLPKYDLFK